MARHTFASIKAWAATLGVKVDLSDMPRAKYDVWIRDSCITECQTLQEVIDEVMSLVETEKLVCNA